ncbi:MAG: hypothetical protein MUF06_10525 [Pirellulaceae bacterium]|nr:hypothetical protein [Pirellulaceae bacterium]
MTKRSRPNFASSTSHVLWWPMNVRDESFPIFQVGAFAGQEPVAQFAVRQSVDRGAGRAASE